MSFRELIFNNFWLKACSLVLATLVWFVIDTNFNPDLSPATPRLAQNPLRPDDTRDIRRPVIVMTSATNRRLYQIEPPEVSVKVRGDAVAVQSLDPEEIQVFVKLMDVPDAQGSFRLDVNAPREFKVQQIWPAHVQVKPLNVEPEAPKTAKP